jgi:lysyl-tRNA synthetase class 2
MSSDAPNPAADISTQPLLDAGSQAGMHKDPVTGELISKQELKRRDKQRKKDAARSSKPPTAAPKTVKAGAEDEPLNPNQYFEIRSRQILHLKETQAPNPYPHKFHVTSSLSQYISTYGVEGKIPPGEKLLGTSVSLAGRLHNIRASSSKLRFYDLHAEGQKVQIMASLQ